MPKGRTPSIRGDLDYFVLCCTIEEIFKGRDSTQERPSLLHHVTSGVTYLLSKVFVENFKVPSTNQILLLCVKRRLKFGTILGNYFFFNGGYGPSISLVFSDDSLKIKVLILAK
jgi:hypothetical protein